MPVLGRQMKCRQPIVMNLAASDAYPHFSYLAASSARGANRHSEVRTSSASKSGLPISDWAPLDVRARAQSAACVSASTAPLDLVHLVILFVFGELLRAAMLPWTLGRPVGAHNRDPKPKMKKTRDLN